MRGELLALLISPDRELAAQFEAAQHPKRHFQFVGHLKNYPDEAALAMRLRQLSPELLIVDVATDPARGCQLIRWAVQATPPLPVVAIHRSHDAETVVRVLREGATEFLHPPFDAATQEQACARILRLQQPAEMEHRRRGKLITFASTKPGGGATTLAVQTAGALQRATQAKVLLADFDLTGGTIGFLLNLDSEFDLTHYLQDPSLLQADLWPQLVTTVGGLDVLPSPAAPYDEAVTPSLLQDFVEFVRLFYDWVVVDLPTALQRTSLLAMSEADKAYLVTTPELPSLHFTKRATSLLPQLGFDSSRYAVAINRVQKRDPVSVSELEALFGCKVEAILPNDYFTIHRAAVEGETLPADSEFGGAIADWVSRIQQSCAPSQPADRLHSTPDRPPTRRP